jgi:mono/diheme cytochrome c family protein
VSATKGLGTFRPWRLLGLAWVVLAVAMTASAVGGCKSGGGSAGDGTEADMEAARQIYETRCVTCHGPQGHGDGPASAGLTPQPRTLSSPEWQQSVTDEHIETIIIGGGAAVGLSPAMPNNPDLRDRPEVVRGLLQMVRGFRQGG